MPPKAIENARAALILFASLFSARSALKELSSKVSPALLDLPSLLEGTAGKRTGVPEEFFSLFGSSGRGFWSAVITRGAENSAGFVEASPVLGNEDTDPLSSVGKPETASSATGSWVIEERIVDRVEYLFSLALAREEI